MSKLIIPPHFTILSDYKSPSIFLAGGITNCPDWQTDVYEGLCVLNLQIISPRQKNFVDNEFLAKKQIEWEYHYLAKADCIAFWFPKETICPITLFEYGKFLNKENIIVGIHPDYPRRLDIEWQTKLERPTVYENISYTLKDFTRQIFRKFEPKIY